MTGSRLATGSLWLERACLVFGLWSLTWCGVVWVRTAAHQRELQAAMRHMAMAGSPAPAPEPAPVAEPRIGPLDLVGQLRIPRLNLSAFIVEGDDDSALEVGVGHLSDTPFPWKDGNSGLAAHRDTVFRPLRNIRIGDDLVLTTPVGDLEYRVASTRVVNPDDVSVLAPTAQPSLTLITCYPFVFVGHAPQRFIVRATRVPSQGRLRLLDGALR